MVGEKDMDEKGELTIEEFITLLRYINKRLEELNRETSRYRRLMGRVGVMGGRPEDIITAILMSSMQSSENTQPLQTAPLEDAVVKEKAKRLVERLRRVEELEGKG